MHYEAELRFTKGAAEYSVVGGADSALTGDHAAVVEAVTLAKEQLQGVSPFQTALLVWHVYPNSRHLIYATTLGQYRIATS